MDENLNWRILLYCCLFDCMDVVIKVHVIQ